MDYLCDTRVAPTVEVAPVETVVATASMLLIVEQGTDMTARLAAIGAVSAGIAMVPVGAKQRD